MTTPWIAVVVALWMFVVVLGLIMLGTLRRIAPILEQAEARLAETPSITGLPLGATVPSFAAREVGGGAFTDADLLGATAAVLFLGASCKACESFVRDLESGRAPDLGLRLVTVVADPATAHTLAQSREVVVVIDEERSLARAFESNIVPQTFVIDEHGRVRASGKPNDWEGVRHLLTIAEGGDSRTHVAAASVAS